MNLKTALVITPKVPSLPIIKCNKSSPIAFLSNFPPKVTISPAGSTTSRPFTKFLVTPYFTDTVWHQAIPARFAQKERTSLEEARDQAFKVYREVGEQRMEWYDIEY